MGKLEDVKMDKVKNIVYAGLYQGWSYDNIISQIMYKIATEEEANILFLWGDIPELKTKAIVLYEKYKEEYYEEVV